MNVVAEIDSLSLLMLCVKDGMGATIKPMSATMMEDRMAKGLRYLVEPAKFIFHNFSKT